MMRQDLFHRYVGLLNVNGRFDDVVAWSKRVLEKEPDRTDALYFLAYGLRKVGKPQEALEKYKAYANKNTTDADPYFGMALCFEALGDRVSAQAAYSAYLKKETRKTHQKWIDKAQMRIAALRSGASLQTAAPTRSPSTLAPPTLPGIPPVATAGVSSNSPQKSLPSAPTASSKAQVPPLPSGPPPTVPAPAKPGAPSPAPLAPLKPVASMDCSIHQKAYKSDPFNTKAYDKFAECAGKAGRHDEVIKAMRIATRDNPEFSRGWFHMGKSLKAKGQATQAKRAFSRACSAGITEACGQ